MIEPKPVPALADCKDSISQFFYLLRQCGEGLKEIGSGSAKKFGESATELVINLPPGAFNSAEEDDVVEP